MPLMPARFLLLFLASGVLTQCVLVTVPVKTAGAVVETTVKTAGAVVEAPFNAVGGHHKDKREEPAQPAASAPQAQPVEE